MDHSTSIQSRKQLDNFDIKQQSRSRQGGRLAASACFIDNVEKQRDQMLEMSINWDRNTKPTKKAAEALAYCNESQLLEGLLKSRANV